jgi:tetratricopeptide (TPR) repeat protein
MVPVQQVSLFGMERQKNRFNMKKILLIILFSVLVSSTYGQNRNTYKQRLYASYIGEQIDQWKGIISEMNQTYARTDDPMLLYDLCFAYYGYIGYLLSKEEEKAAKTELKDAMKKSDMLEETLPDRPEVFALQGAFLGYRIVLSKFSSLFLGPKALKYINKAYESSNTCFNCNTEMGNMRFYTPKFLGGSKTEAIQYYKKGVEILETSELKTERDWIYMNTVLLLANAYLETDQQELACKLYEQLLEYEPKADWIRKDLYSKCPSR